MRLLVIFFVVSCVAVSSALYNQCSGANFEALEEKVKVEGCKTTYCRLRKKTQVAMHMRFTPDKPVNKVTNTVTATIAGIPFPFIGVDGENACPNIFEADGTTKANCPLKANTEYIYKNVINVLEIYPRLKVIVHWGLTKPDGKDLMCFEVPAKITN